MYWLLFGVGLFVARGLARHLATDERETTSGDELTEEDVARAEWRASMEKERARLLRARLERQRNSR